MARVAAGAFGFLISTTPWKAPSNRVRRASLRQTQRPLRSAPASRPLPADPYPAHGRPLPARPAAAAAAAAACAASPASSAATAATAATAAFCAAAAFTAAATFASAAALASAAATAAFGRNSYALVELGFVLLVEDIERRQADVRDFLLTECNHGTRRGVFRRYIRCRRSSNCAAPHRQRHPGGSTKPPTISPRSSLRVCHRSPPIPCLWAISANRTIFHAMCLGR